jgi:tRNA pseudouridine13 synthase
MTPDPYQAVAGWTITEWPHALGKPSLSGQLRRQPEDFEVEEIPAFEPTGEGSHLWLWVEKAGANTDWVATQLARAAGCPPRDVGYAGMKDRHAVTRQWFSLPWKPGQAPEFPDPGIEGVRVLRASLHEKKLRRGVLKGNRFQLRIRGLQGDVSGLGARLQRITDAGVPNYFGPQRFGFGGANVSRALRWLEQGGRLPRDKRSIYLSALRSYLFNQVLGQRVVDETWNRLLPGELAMLDGTHSIFPCESLDDTLLQRCREMDIHPTGPMPGRGGMQPSAGALAMEQGVLEPYADAISRLDHFGVDAERRSLRLPVRGLFHEVQQHDLVIGFDLPAGAYATVVLRELVATDTPE